MPLGGPRIGRSVWGVAQTSSAEELTEAPQAELLGTLDADALRRLDEQLPPWETDPKYTSDNTNARRFIDCPDYWELRWLNPRQVDQSGMRDWQAVSANDPRVSLKVPAMHAPDGTIRRGGHGGSFLAYMPKTWVESRQRVKSELVRRRTQSAPDRQQQTVDEIRRGNFGPYVHVDSARHPTRTIGDGATMTDN